MRSIQNLESCRDDKKGVLSCVALKKKKDLREERLLLAFFLPRPPPPGPRVRGEEKWREKEQMDSIPYIEHSFLSIDRKIFVKYRTFPFFLFSFF